MKNHPDYQYEPEECKHKNLETVADPKGWYILCYHCGAYLKEDGEIIELHPKR